MGFRCVECGMDFPSINDLEQHRKTNKMCAYFEHKNDDKVMKLLDEARSLFGVKNSNRRNKKYVDLAAIECAVNDGRIAIWVDGNGMIHIRNNRSKNEVIVTPTYDMDNWMDD